MKIKKKTRTKTIQRKPSTNRATCASLQYISIKSHWTHTHTQISIQITQICHICCWFFGRASFQYNQNKRDQHLCYVFIRFFFFHFEYLVYFPYLIHLSSSLSSISISRARELLFFLLNSQAFVVLYSLYLSIFVLESNFIFGYESNHNQGFSYNHIYTIIILIILLCTHTCTFAIIGLKVLVDVASRSKEIFESVAYLWGKLLCYRPR